MKNILVLGAGRSSTVLIKYLFDNAAANDWIITVADVSIELSKQKTKGYSGARAIAFDVNDPEQRTREISCADLVISMLPASMHAPVAKDCVVLQKHLITASYVSPEIKLLDEDAKKAGVLLLNEIGVDPGIDHMIAMQEIESIRANGAELLRFESFTGGLLAPESDNNPWNYKFTWNPRNVVIAGQGTAMKFIQEGQYKYIPYHRVFRRTEIIEIEDYGRFEGYANRDSLKYIDIYGLAGIPTIYRGTLRRPGFCRAWDTFVQLGATDDSYIIEGSEDMTHRQFINSFLAYNLHDSVELKLMQYLHIDQDSDILEKLKWLGIFDNTKIGLKNATPAQILQHILEKKWSLEPEDKDMVVMWNKFVYWQGGEKKDKEVSMIAIGEDQVHTAMAKTVGLPAAIAAKLILQNKINFYGVQLPIRKEIYRPVLEELKEFGVDFKSKMVCNPS